MLYCEFVSPVQTSPWINSGSISDSLPISFSAWQVVLFESQSGQLINNLSLTNEHAAKFENLRPATLYSALVYALNEQGKSTPLRLQTATLGPPEKRQMSQSKFIEI